MYFIFNAQAEWCASFCLVGYGTQKRYIFLYFTRACVISQITQNYFDFPCVCSSRINFNPQFAPLGGVDLCELDPLWFRGKMSMVSQEPSLFACSIKENISYGRDTTDEEVCPQYYDSAVMGDFGTLGVKRLTTYQVNDHCLLSSGHAPLPRTMDFTW